VRTVAQREVKPLSQTASVSLAGNRYSVDQALVGRRV
jgi:hypothetical protein